MIATLNNHVLFPALDWSQSVTWSRKWETQMSDAVDGKTSRLALRSVARHTLNFSVFPRSQNETAQLDDAIRQAKKFGLACAPFFGRGCPLLESFTGNTLTCARGWDWTEGDYVFLRNGNGYEISTIAAAEFADGAWTLELADALTGTYRSFAWPMIFGKFTCSEMTVQTPRHGPVQFSIRELTNSRSVQIGVTPVNPDGIGVMELESTFVVA